MVSVADPRAATCRTRCGRGTSDADHATAGIRRSSTAPDLVIVDAGGDAAPLTRLIEWVRGAVEDEQLPIVAVLHEHSSWRRKTPPRDLQPLIVVATTVSVSELVHAAVTHAADGAPAGGGAGLRRRATRGHGAARHDARHTVRGSHPRRDDP